MKPIVKSLIMLAALFTMTNAIAKENATLASSVSFQDAGAGIIELVYNGTIQDRMTVEIFGKKKRPIYKEVLKHQERFKKPFNLRSLPYGSYTMRVSTKNEIIEHEIHHKAPEFPGLVRVSVHPQKDRAFKYQILGPEPKLMTLLIFDDNNRELHRETISTLENYGKVFTFKRAGTKTLEFVLLAKGEVINNQKVRLQ